MYIRKKCRIAVIVIVILILFFSQKNCIAVENITNESTNSIENIPSILDEDVLRDTNADTSYDESIIIDCWGPVLKDKNNFKEILVIGNIVSFLIILITTLKSEKNKKIKKTAIIIEVITILISYLPSKRNSYIRYFFSIIICILYAIEMFLILMIIKNSIYSKQKIKEKIILYCILILQVIISIITIISVDFETMIEYYTAIGGIIFFISYMVNAITGVIIAIKSLIKRKE